MFAEGFYGHPHKVFKRETDRQTDRRQNYDFLLLSSVLCFLFFYPEVFCHFIPGQKKKESKATYPLSS